MDEYDESIKILNTAMRLKLSINSHKGNIGDVDPQVLVDFLRREVDELALAIREGKPGPIILEAADCANFALSAAMNAIRISRNK